MQPGRGRRSDFRAHTRWPGCRKVTRTRTGGGPPGFRKLPWSSLPSHGVPGYQCFLGASGSSPACPRPAAATLERGSPRDAHQIHARTAEPSARARIGSAMSLPSYGTLPLRGGSLDHAMRKGDGPPRVTPPCY